MSLGTMGGLYEGAAMNPARALGPNLAIGRLDVVWVYVLGSLIGAAVAVALDRVLRGRATKEEAGTAESEPARDRCARAGTPSSLRLRARADRRGGRGGRDRFRTFAPSTCRS